MSKARWMGNVRRTDPGLAQLHAISGQKDYVRPNAPRHAPTGALPRTDRKLGAGAGFAAMLHALAVVLLSLGGRALILAGDGRGPGAVGGGGGGGNESVHFINLPPAPPRPAPVAMAAPDPEDELQQVVFVLPKPDLKVIPPELAEIPPPQTVQRLVVSRPQDVGSGTGEGAGTGSGNGGGVGSGSGTGVGSNVGPGSGGGGAAYAPEPRSILYPFEDPPASVRGKEYTIHFWVNRRGRVTRVRIEPEIEDGDFRKKLLDRMYQWVFYAARTEDGRSVQGEYSITYAP